MKIVAHRGYSSRFAENSPIAFEQAITAGADFIETDVRLTSNGVAVCWHDADLKRVAGIDLAIANTPLESLVAIELPGGAQIQTLNDVLVIARGRVRVLLDVKLDDDAVRAAIIDAVEANAMSDAVVYGVRTASHARALSMRHSHIARLLMPARPHELAGYTHAGAIGVRLWEDQVDAESLARIRAAGLQVWVTAGLRDRGEAPGFVTAERLRALAALSVDAVLVNDVGLARATLYPRPN